MCTDRQLSIKFSGYHRLTCCLSVRRYNSRHVDQELADILTNIGRLSTDTCQTILA